MGVRDCGRGTRIGCCSTGAATPSAARAAARILAPEVAWDRLRETALHYPGYRASTSSTDSHSSPLESEECSWSLGSCSFAQKELVASVLFSSSSVLSRSFGTSPVKADRTPKPWRHFSWVRRASGVLVGIVQTIPSGASRRGAARSEDGLSRMGSEDASGSWLLGPTSSPSPGDPCSGYCDSSGGETHHEGGYVCHVTSVAAVTGACRGVTVSASRPRH